MSKKRESKMTSVRLSEAAFDSASQQSPHLSKCVIRGLAVLLDRYPQKIAYNELERLHRHKNMYDTYINGSSVYTKIRLPVAVRDFCKFNSINISAACEWAILDAPRYMRRERAIATITE